MRVVVEYSCSSVFHVSQEYSSRAPVSPATPARLYHVPHGSDLSLPHKSSPARPGPQPALVLTSPQNGGGFRSFPLSKHDAVPIPPPLFGDASSPGHVTTENSPNFGTGGSSDSSASEGDSFYTMDDYGDVDANSPLSPHLSQLLNLGGRSVYSLQGREAAETGSKLHSVSFYR
jgi:hypothetical protein